MHIKKIFYSILLILIYATSNAQLNIDITTYTPTQLVQQKLINGCLTASNVVFHGESTQIGYFNATGTAATALNFPSNNSGVILSSGNVQDAVGPNSNSGTSTITTTNYVDPELDLIVAPYGINDCSVLEFDFVPASDTVEFRFIFASEEYPEFVNGGFNDAFGFFVTGPNPLGGNYTNYNIALIPGTTTPITIDNVNNGTSTPTTGPCQNCAYYIDNSTANYNIEYDGYTTPITARVIVNPCQTYHIKLAVGDAGDQSYDSAVLLEEGSFSSGTSIVMNNFTSGGNQTNQVYEGCSNYYQFCRLDTTNLANSSDLPINLNISGTAINGTDFTNFPTNLTIPAGAACTTVNYDGILDGINDPNEYFVIELLSGCPCNPTPTYDTIRVIDIPQIQGGINETDTIICGSGSGGTITYSSWTNLDTNITNYAWSNGSTTPNITINIPTNDTTYYLTITDPCNQIIIDSVKIFFSDLQFSTSVSNISCYGGTDGSIIVNPTNGVSPYNFNWSNGQTNDTINNLLAGNYNVTITDAYGCHGDSSITIVEPAALSSNISHTDLTCYNDNSGSANILVNGGTAPYTYLWSNGSTSQSATNLSADTYTIIISDANNCTIYNSVTLTQPNKITLHPTVDDINCYGDSTGNLYISATGGFAPYNYNWSNGTIGQNNTNLSSGSYSVTVSDNNGCQNDTTLTINQATPITYTNTSTPASCYGYYDGTASVQPSGGTAPYTYQWSNGSTNQSINNLLAGFYSLTITDNKNCKVFFNVEVSQPDEVVAAITPEIKICIGQDTLLEGSATGGTPPYYYTWNTGENTSDIRVNPLNNTNYSFSITDSHGCTSNTAETQVTINPPLDINISLSKNYICKGDPVIIYATATGGDGLYTYTLENGNQQIIIPYNYYSQEVNFDNIKVILTDKCGSPSAFDTISLKILPLPEFTFQPDITNGCQPLLVNFNSIATNDYSYSWNFGDENNNSNLSNSANPSHTYTDDGNYSITLIAKSDSGCINSLTANNLIIVYKNPESKFISDPEIIDILNPNVNFTNLSLDANEYYWYFGDGDSSTEENAKHTYKPIVGEYIIKLVSVSEMGCKDSIFGKVKVKDHLTFYAPNAFTPDGDGINDTWQIKGNGIDESNFELLIFNRWGEIVFNTNNLSDSWDGKIKKNKIGEIGSYTWVANFKDYTGLQHQKTGTISIIK